MYLSARMQVEGRLKAKGGGREGRKMKGRKRRREGERKEGKRMGEEVPPI